MPTLLLDDIPSADVKPAGASRSHARRSLIVAAFGRRAFIKGALVSASATALVSLDGILKLAPGFALPPTWGKCADYSDWDNGLWPECNPAANDGVDTDPHTHIPIGSSYCNADDYHRNDEERLGLQNGEWVWRNYERRPNSCKNRNAWVWRISNNPGIPNKRDRRCSDGKYRHEVGGSVGSWRFSVCEKLLPITGSPVTPDHA
ncbi:hypothetical protein [Pimelobacter simplex]|uniref:hypothetical protein n=1 Tax=Nocardioides simplex TaxID=2045 RepID=UPI00214F6A0F|nr:hypothetical protein [Pimelobacter simplex]UUW92641.1 hypothetical protein M0M43_14495 [Pimelobacter simplex]UUW96468.1 hypothetical protein M0M48_03125 [Pimelobacter simplex]